MVALHAILLALALSGSVAEAPILGLDDVLRELERGVPAADVARRIAESGAFIEIHAEEAARLHFAGVPEVVLRALFASTGEPVPGMTLRPGEIELLYDGFRIVARPGPHGPRLAVSGYDREGHRLRPPVAEPEPAVERASVLAPAPPREDYPEDPPAMSAQAYVNVVDQAPAESYGWYPGGYWGYVPLRPPLPPGPDRPRPDPRPLFPDPLPSSFHSVAIFPPALDSHGRR